ncbi:ribose import ATP-binding protein RbsA [Marinobacterium nitratireducens]|uniref:Ribose import ATP-binding protein RbsA n=1 Tax=Marinobacterium nitratireducens TaxID=518897 RepID=A0A918DPG1_9GAMM|nr:sugar ABC transporter ATP-binding protein [Marinobacterium nitratireducens]GGO76358.1 ribose import ATP-binding protein RbsA [Marinobacterium nitratireducens]
MSKIRTISLKNISKSFGETRALSNCSFEAYAGEVHAVVGENGCGKSTLAKIISGVLLPDSGEIEILGGVNTTPLDARRLGVATIFQEVLVADEANVLDNLFVGSEGFFSVGKSESEKVREASELLTRCIGHDIDLFADVGSLPLNIKQWVVIARAILRRPKVVILDESSAALDLDATNRLHGEIDRLRNEGCTVLIVTHRIAELVRIADRATILRDGAPVGVLEKSEITEAKLLELMTPSDRSVMAQPNVDIKDNKSNLLDSIIEGKSIQLTEGSHSFDFELKPGTIVGLAGLDGHGQDLFARTLAGLYRQNSGTITFRKESGEFIDIDGLERASDLHISWVSGDRKKEGIFPQRSIFDNFAFGIYRRNLGWFGKINKRYAQKAFAQEVKRLKIKTGNTANKITSLSGGNQQKVLISRAFADQPKVIVLNDPARGVDLNTKRDLYKELRNFTESGGAVVYLSSEIEEFLGFADRVDVFYQNAIFRSLDYQSVSEESMLAAMFGQPLGSHVEIV